MSLCARSYSFGRPVGGATYMDGGYRIVTLSIGTAAGEPEARYRNEAFGPHIPHQRPCISSECLLDVYVYYPVHSIHQPATVSALATHHRAAPRSVSRVPAVMVLPFLRSPIRATPSFDRVSKAIHRTCTARPHRNLQHPWFAPPSNTKCRVLRHLRLSIAGG